MNTIWKYILKDGVPVEERDLVTWANWIENHQDEMVVNRQIFGEIEVSTVFLGLDYSLGQGDKKLLFETIVFGGQWTGQAQWRYSTRKEAENGHEAVVKTILGL